MLTSVWVCSGERVGVGVERQALVAFHWGSGLVGGRAALGNRGACVCVCEFVHVRLYFRV